MRDHGCTFCASGLRSDFRAGLRADEIVLGTQFFVEQF